MSYWPAWFLNSREALLRMSFSGSTVYLTVIPVCAVNAAVCFCSASICGLLTISTVIVLPESDLSMYGSGASAAPALPLAAGADALAAGAEALAGGADALAAGAEALAAGAELLPAAAGVLAPAADVGA